MIQYKIIKSAQRVGIMAGLFLTISSAWAAEPMIAPTMLSIPAGENVAAFQLAETEVTQSQWQAVMGNNPSDFKACGGDCPVERVSYDDVMQFVQKLNTHTGKTYRLPTEPEWFHACQAGEKTTFCGGNEAEPLAWFLNNSNHTTHPVKGKQANAFGLYDMSGNVWEWTQSCFATPDCSRHVLRGGSWFSNPKNLRASFRIRNHTAQRYNYGGFRLAMDAP